MSVPAITSVTSIPNWGVGVPFDFALQATNTPTSWAITGLLNGISYNTTTGLISGTPTKACHLDCTAIATNGSGASAEMRFVIIVPGDSLLGEPAIVLDYDLESGAVTSAQGTASASAATTPPPILYGKTKSKLLIAVGFVRGGSLASVIISGLHLAIKEFIPEPLLLLTSGAFRVVQTEDGPRYLILVDLTSSAWANVESNYEDDVETFLDARSELTPTFMAVVLPDTAPVELPRGSQTFGFRIALSLK